MIIKKNSWYSNIDIAYLNWASQTRVSKKLDVELASCLKLLNSQHSSPEKIEKLLYNKVQMGKVGLQKLLNLNRDDNIIFTDGAISALRLLCHRLAVTGKDITVYTSDCELPVAISVLKSYFKTKIFHFDDFIYATLKDQSKSQKIFFVSHVTFIFGAILNIFDFVQLVRKKFPDSIIILDGSQAVGNVRVDLSDLDVDAYLFNTNKWLLCGPSGVLVLRNFAHFNSDNLLLASPFSGKSVDDNCSSTSGINLNYSAALVSGVSCIANAMHNDRLAPYRMRLKLNFWNELNGRINLVLADKRTLTSESGILTFCIKTTKSIPEFISVASNKGLLLKSFSVARRGKVEEIIRVSIHYFNTQEEINRATDFISSYFNR